MSVLVSHFLKYHINGIITMCSPLCLDPSLQHNDFQIYSCWCIYQHVRKHLTGGFLCAVLDLSEIFWSLLIPEYSGIKRRGISFPFPGLRNPGISLYGDKYPLPLYEPYSKKVIICNSLFDRDHLMFSKSGILIFIFAENNHLVTWYICPCHSD